MTPTKVYASDGVYIGCWFRSGPVIRCEDRWAEACQRETVEEAVAWMTRRYERRDETYRPLFLGHLLRRMAA